MSVQQSGFQFQNPILTKARYNINPKNSEGSYDEIRNIQTNVRVDRSRINERRAIVALNLKMGTSTTQFELEMEMQSSFRWDDSFEEKDINNLLNQNAPALLLSYMRPLVSQLTGYGFQSIKLPFIDFSKNTDSSSKSVDDKG